MADFLLSARAVRVLSLSDYLPKSPECSTGESPHEKIGDEETNFVTHSF
jgi:hypothetical protein